MRNIIIKGLPSETGRICGSLFKDVLIKRASELTEAKKKELGPDAARLREILASFAPGWLDELRGIEASSGVPSESLLMLNCSSPSGNCTSVMSVNAGYEPNILHKNRDEKPLPQFLLIKQASGCHKYLAGGTVGDLGIASFLNEKGLAGANNSGSITRREELSAGGLSDCHVMRLAAENASCCEKALEIISSLVKNRVCGSAGNGRGMIFLFADAEKGLIVENTSRSLIHEFVDDGVVCRTNDYLFPEAQEWIDNSKAENQSAESSAIRLKRAEELLAGNRVTEEGLMKLSRDTANYPLSINNDAGDSPTMTLSSLIHVVRKELTEVLSLSWICHGNPSYACFFPSYIGGFSSLDAYCGYSGGNGGLFSDELRVSEKHRAELEAFEAEFYVEEEDFRRAAPGRQSNGLGEALDKRNLERAGAALSKNLSHSPNRCRS